MRLVVALLTAVVLLPAPAATANDSGHFACCQSCGRKVCCPEVKVKKETRQCWEVECKDVCIPAIRFPWMDCNELRCGRVRTVRVLKPVDYDVEKCEYQWKVLCDQCRQSAQSAQK